MASRDLVDTRDRAGKVKHCLDFSGRPWRACPENTKHTLAVMADVFVTRLGLNSLVGRPTSLSSTAWLPRLEEVLVGVTNDCIPAISSPCSTPIPGYWRVLISWALVGHSHTVLRWSRIKPSDETLSRHSTEHSEDMLWYMKSLPTSILRLNDLTVLQF